MIGYGNNDDGRICSHFKKPLGHNYGEFSIKDSNGNNLIPISAVCCSKSTLYMCSKSKGKGRQLILCNSDINEGQPIFLNIGNQDPIALYGGAFYAAAISSEGKIIFINSSLIEKSPLSSIRSYTLPDGAKASSVALINNKCYVLSSNGQVFSSYVKRKINNLLFSYVEQLQNEKIVYLSGTESHALAVTRDGRVFGCGSNEHGKLGFNKKRENVYYFTEIHALKRIKISAAYAGANHSLFMTQEGKILSCGDNRYGQLLLKNNLSKEVYTPSHSIIKKGATFCIAGEFISEVFIGCYPPTYTPNTKIELPE